MTLKSTRGIQPEDVYQAADALIAAGLRPTIERVRQKIGRGSPNTVSPLLDAWFSTLAARLGLDGAPEESAQLPEPVKQAATLLWEAALLSARDEAAQALTQAHQALAIEQAELERKADDFEHEKQALIARQLAADAALQVARSQLGDMALRLEATGAALSRRELDMEALREKLAIREAERDADLRRSAEEVRRHAQERARLEDRATANEQRLLQELDRERQDARRLKTALAEQAQRAAATHTQLSADNRSLAARLQEMAYELKAAEQTLELANSRAGELGALLEAQKSAHATTLKQLDLVLAGSPRKTGVRPLIRRRV